MLYKFDISATPNYHDNKHKPYWWCLLGCTEGSDVWCNEGFGWAETSEKAFTEANEFYNNFKKKK